MNKIRLNFQTISPVHINTGDDNDLIYGLDYFVEKDILTHFNRTQFLQDTDLEIDDISQISLVSLRNKFLGNKENLKEYLKYKIKVDFKFQKRYKKEVALLTKDHQRKPPSRLEIKEFFNQNGQFYIPASSIKGALLTVLDRPFLGIRKNGGTIKQKFVIRDSDIITAESFKVRCFSRNGIPSAFVVLDKGSNFVIDIVKRGDLKVDNLKRSLKNYYDKQIDLAIKKINELKNLESKPNFLKSLEYIRTENDKLGDDEYLLNIGFGGSGWFKTKKGKESKVTSKNGRLKQVAHTGYTSKIDDQIFGLGWCKLKIIID